MQSIFVILAAKTMNLQMLNDNEEKLHIIYSNFSSASFLFKCAHTTKVDPVLQMFRIGQRDFFCSENDRFGRSDR